MLKIYLNLIFILALFFAQNSNGLTPPISKLPDDFRSRKAIAYSGFRDGKSPDRQEYPTKAEIFQDMQILTSCGFGLIRLFGSDEYGARILNVIDSCNFDIKVMLGIWLTSSKNNSNFNELNNTAIKQAIELANKYPNIVLAVSVGNENTVDWAFNPVNVDDMVKYIGTVKGSIAQPVTTDDNWEPYNFVDEKGNHYPYVGREKITAAVDFLSIHIYPIWDSKYGLWDWKQDTVSENLRAQAMMSAALQYAKKNYYAVKDSLANRNITIPIVIGETGWRDVDDYGKNFKYTAHQVNQKMYYDSIENWVYGDGKEEGGPAACFYFTAFDESWKKGDDHWGLFTSNRVPKYVAWGNHIQPKPSTAPNYTLADANYFGKDPTKIIRQNLSYKLLMNSQSQSIVFNLSGQRIEKFASGNKKSLLSENRFSNGMYIFRIDNNQTSIKKSFVLIK